jgi:hypothetical protein
MRDNDTNVESALPQQDVDAERQEVAALMGRLLAWDWRQRRAKQDTTAAAPAEDTGWARCCSPATRRASL